MKKKEKVQKRKERGITLVALVVTIVVLLILAGITINLILGNNSIFDLARKAGEETNNAVGDEMALLGNLTNYLEEGRWKDKTEENTKGIETADGGVEFTGLDWTDGKAHVTVNKKVENGYKIQYRVVLQEDIEEEQRAWTLIEDKGIIADLNHGELVEVRFYDGSAGGTGYAKFPVSDENPPNHAVIDIPGYLGVGIAEVATVSLSDDESGIDISECKYVFSGNDSYTETSEIWDSPSAKPLQEINAKIQITPTRVGYLYLVVLSVDRAGNRRCTTSMRVRADDLE